MSEDALVHTRTEARARGVENIDFIVGDVHALEIPDASYDVVHAHQVLQHVSDPVAAIAEMVRVCRPGGLVAARDGDYSGFTWHPASEGLDRWLSLYKTAARRNGGEPDAGRRLLDWAYQAGCSNVVATSSTWCYADPASRHEWGEMWAERIVHSAIADQLIDDGLASRSDLEEISTAWRAWAAEPSGWISVLHGEVLIRVG
jgi:SAM-dependent methyltransferase